MEVDALREYLEEAAEMAVAGLPCLVGNVRGHPCVLAETAAGKTNAAMVTTLLLAHFRPRLVLLAGIGGGLNPSLRWGDTVIVEQVVHHDYGAVRPEGMTRWPSWNPIKEEENPLYLPTDADLVARAMAAAERVNLPAIDTREGRRKPKIVRGTLATGEAFLTAPDGRSALWRELGADIVDMEGAAVVQVARHLGVPTLIIRCISDVDDQDEEVEEVWERVLHAAAGTAAQLVAAFVKSLESQQT